MEKVYPDLITCEVKFQAVFSLGNNEDILRWDQKTLLEDSPVFRLSLSERYTVFKGTS